jgi:hypothetical protein
MSTIRTFSFKVQVPSFFDFMIKEGLHMTVVLSKYAM